MLRQFLEQDGKGYRLPYPATGWEDGILLGNGRMGADLCGFPEDERIILTQEKLYAPADVGVTSIPMAEHLEEIREWIRKGKPETASDYIVDMFKEKEHLEEKLWTNPFFPAADLRIFTENCVSYVNYERSLTFSTGLGKISFESNGNVYEREAFISRKENCLVLRLRAKHPASYLIRLAQTPYIKNGMHVNKKLFRASGGEDFFLTDIDLQEQGIRYYCQYNGRKNGYGVILTVKYEKGSLHRMGQQLRLEECTDALLLISVFPVDDRSEVRKWEEEERRLWKLLEKGNVEGIYQSLYQQHESVHKERFDRMVLTLHNKHLEAMFHAGRYEILSSAGETPPNLQGIWTGTYETPWSSDYTQNGNLQTAILGMLPCGDFEGMRSLFDYEESMLPDFRTNSLVLYGCRGIHIPSRTSDSGIDFHFDKTWPMLFWTAGAGWISHFYYDYWLYTGDDEFFTHRALPFMKEAALFYEDFLQEDSDGRWIFNPSYSPENTPDNRENAACINATMDISVATELFRNLITGCRTLGIEEENIAGWEKMLSKMPPYLINEEGALKEWADPSLQDRYDHRHSSHLYMLYYGRAKEESSEILAAARKAYEIKMERKKEEQGTMAFGLVQAGMAAAHLGDSEMVDIMLQSMAENNYYRTYASSHDYGPSIFNADISGGIPALMLESIVQCYPVCDEHRKITGYEIYLLPALPASMKDGEVKNVCLRGGMRISLSWEDGQLTDYQIENPLNRVYTLSVGGDFDLNIKGGQ